MPVDIAKVVDKAVGKLKDGYELEEEFLNSYRDFLNETLKKHYVYASPQAPASEASAPTVKEKKNTTPRAKTPYNLFVSENMSKFNDIPQKERMGKVAELWKGLSDEEKAKYKERAQAAKQPE